MSNPRTTLNRHVLWLPLLESLGVTVNSRALPARTKCPVCRDGIIQIYEDRTCGGQWYRCPGCKKSGDMIELASRVWGLGMAETAVRLSRQGFELPADDHAVKNYVRQHVNYRRRLLKFWKQAKENYIQTIAACPRLVSELNLRCDVPDQRLRNGPAILLGVADKTSVERCFAPGVMEHADAHHQKSSPSAHAIFKGEGWGDVLVVPFYDLPWRIRSFLFIGRDGDREKDMVIKLANIAPPGNHFTSEVDLGLSLHPNVLDIAENWGHTVFALSDPVTALQLQMRNFESSIHPLPIVVWHDTRALSIHTSNGRPARTTHAWQILESRKIVFWMPNLHPAVIQQAAEVDGWISTVGPRRFNEASIKDYCWKLSPRDLLLHIQKNARPWHVVLARELDDMTDAAVENLFNRLQVAGEDVEEIARRCGSKVANRVANILAVRQGQRSITFDGYTITERKNSWYVSGKKYKTSEQITDAILRLDVAIHQRKTARLFFRGRILYGGEEVHFCESADRIEKDTFGWMRQRLMEEGKGFMWFNPGWSDKAATIAKQFQETKLRNAADTIGWEAEGSRFVLPNFAIALGGAVEAMEAPVFLPTDPAHRIEPPAALSPEELERPVSTDPSTGAIFWATMTAALSNIVAPAFNEMPSGIALHGAGAESIGKAVAEAMGCVVHTVHNAESARQAINAEHEQSWPIVFGVEQSLQRRHRKFLVEQDDAKHRNCIVSRDWFNAMAQALDGSWHVIVSEHATDAPRDIVGLAGQILPAYLQDLCRRGLNLDHWENPLDSFAEEVLRDLARFVDESNGNGKDVLGALKFLWPSREYGHPLALADLLGRFIRDGDLAIEDDNYAKRKPALIRVPDVDGLFLRYKTLAKLLKNYRVPVPKKMKISATLAKPGFLIEDRDGFVFPESWLLDRIFQDNLETARLAGVQQ